MSAPTPSKGAMLAANGIACSVQGTGWSENEEAHAARIIDEHTGAADLLAALRKARQFISSEWGEEECEFIDTLLTKHTTK